MDDASSGDPVAGAFDRIAEVGEETARDAEQISQLSREASKERSSGASITESLASGRPQEILSQVERTAKRLMVAGGTLRKALVSGLSREGMGVSAVSRLFGVSHQRISALMQKSRAGTANVAHAANDLANREEATAPD